MKITIMLRLAIANDLMIVLFVKNTLNYMQFEQLELQISYLMGARMDRVMIDGKPFCLKVIAAI